MCAKRVRNQVRSHSGSARLDDCCQPDLCLRALAGSHRLALVIKLCDAEMNVTELVEWVGLSQPTVSQHLNVLQAAGLVQVRQVGQQHLYRTDTHRLNICFGRLLRQLQVQPCRTEDGEAKRPAQDEQSCTAPAHNLPETGSQDRSMDDILHVLMAAVEQNQTVVLASVIQVAGASPAQPGFKLLVRNDGTVLGNVGGGELEARIIADAQTVLAEGRPRTAHYNLREEGPDALGTLCGGEVTVFLEPYLPRPTLLIVGGGHIGRPLAELGRVVGYAVEVVDNRPARADRPQLAPETVTAATSVVLITEDHTTDEQALRAVLDTPAAYIGMIGSRRKVGLILENLRRDSYSEVQLARVRAPIGLDLGGRQPAEIALSILAEVEAVRHGGSGRPRSSAPDLAALPAASEKT